jgi:hypothetical protein
MGRETKEYCEFFKHIETWTEKGWTRLYRVIRHPLAYFKNMVRVITPTGIVDVTDDHSLLTPDGVEISPKNLKKGTDLLHHSLPEYKKDFKQTFSHRNYDNQYDTMLDYWKYTKQGYLLEIKYGNGIYRLVERDEIIFPNRVIEYYTIPYDGYVYDLTTSNHHFSAGIGNLVVHNTDSVFFTFNLKDPETKEAIVGKKALEITIEIANEVADLCSKWLKPPMCLTYEKTLMPFILLSKKRYVGMLYENNPNKGKMKFMGLSIKRRDSCDYLKDTYGEILQILMKEQNIEKAIDCLKLSMNTLLRGDVSIDKLLITKALRGYYKNPAQIAHNVLAERIAQRDPGNKPKPGDRMRFIHFENNSKKALQGDKIETPEYILANNLKIDYSFYITNQLMKPLQQLFGLAVLQIAPKHLKTRIIADLNELESKNTDLEVYMKQRETYCSKLIKQFIFDDFMRIINNRKMGNSTIFDTINKQTTQPMTTNRKIKIAEQKQPEQTQTKNKKIDNKEKVKRNRIPGTVYTTTT